MSGGSQARRRGVVALVVCVVSALVAVPAGAQTSDPPSVDGQGAASTSSTSVPDGPTTTLPGGSTTSTTVPATTVPPEIADDPRAPVFLDPGAGDGGDAPVGQRAYDPGTQRVLDPARVAAAQGRIDGARRALVLVQGRLVEVERQLATLRAELRRLGGDRRRKVAEVAAARRELRDHALHAYMTGRPGNAMTFVAAGDPVQMGVAHRYLRTVVAGDDAVVRRYEAARRQLDSRSARLSEQVAATESQANALRAQMESAVGALGSAAKEFAAYSAGAALYVDGFVFPVAGPVDFIDSWGYPRMSGTSYAHWHQGTDIFAALGTPLVAVEDGTLARIGTGTLGGNKLWVVGASGTEYYYAHLSAFAPGIRDGQPVRRGQVVGFVGDTGNARGTPYHLHFEIHPGGDGPVNPYPLLKAVHSAGGAVGTVLGSPQVPLPSLAPLAPLAAPPTSSPTTTVAPARAGG